MTREEVLALRAGRELNVLVSEEIMGHKVIEDEIFGTMERLVDDKDEIVYAPLLPYSEDLSSARIVVNRMRNLGHDRAGFWENDKDPELICRASLLAVMERNRAKEKKETKSRFRIVK